MKKLLIFLLLVGLGWMSWLSYSVMQISSQQTELQSELHQAEKSNAVLNDQLAALQRQPDEQKGHEEIPQKNTADAELPETAINPAVLIKQQLDFVAFALQQQKYPMALDRLTALDSALDQYLIAPALRLSLKQSLQKDRAVILQFIKARSEQSERTAKLLQQIDAQLVAAAKQQPEPGAQDSGHFWQKWLTIESAEAPSALLLNRQIVLKEAQLRLLLARQLLANGQYTEYQFELNAVGTLLKQLPDQQARLLEKQLNSIRTETVIAVPDLSTRALLG